MLGVRLPYPATSPTRPARPRGGGLGKTATTTNPRPGGPASRGLLRHPLGFPRLQEPLKKGFASETPEAQPQPHSLRPTDATLKASAPQPRSHSLSPHSPDPTAAAPQPRSHSRSPTALAQPRGPSARRESAMHTYGRRRRLIRKDDDEANACKPWCIIIILQITALPPRRLQNYSRLQVSRAPVSHRYFYIGKILGRV